MSDVLTALETKSEKIVVKALGSLPLCQVFMALVGKCVFTAFQRGKSWEGISIGSVEMGGRRIKAKINFWSFKLSQQPGFLEHVDGIVEFVHRKADQLGKVVAMNGTFLKLLEELTKRVEVYAKDKGKKFSEVRFEKAFIDQDDNLVLELEA